MCCTCESPLGERRLLRSGADIHWRHPQGGATALYVACEFGHAEAARVLLEAGAPADAARDDGATPLYKACQDGGRPEIAQLLLSKGAMVNRADPAGMTPLWLACHQARSIRRGFKCLEGVVGAR